MAQQNYKHRNENKEAATPASTALFGRHPVVGPKVHRLPPVAAETTPNELRQPQDGTPTIHRFIAPIRSFASTAKYGGGHSSQEPEDAFLTGGTRSLFRRLMGLNVDMTSRRPAVSKVLGRKSALTMPRTIQSNVA